MLKKTIFAIMALVFLQCHNFQNLFNTEHVDGVTISQNAQIKIGVGYFENRTPDLASGDTQNFHDMLEYQLMRLGYNTAAQSDFAKPPHTKLKKRNNMSDKSENSKIKSKSILPSQYNNIAGITDESPDQTILSSVMLNRIQINSLSTREKLTFYIQGSFSRNTQGSLLDPEYHTTVFIQMYDASGTKKGMVVYYFEANTLENPDLMYLATQKIADKLKTQVQNAN